MFWTASNALIGGSIIPLPSTLKKNLYHKHVKYSREEQRSGGCGEGSVLATSAHCQKIENHCGEQQGEWMSFAWRGRSDISTPTVCQSAFPVMYGCYMAPLTQQNQSILPCWGMLEHETMGACDPCYGMTKLREGGGEGAEAIWAYEEEGGGRLFHHSISHSLQSCGGIWEIAHWKTTKQKRLYGCHLWLRLGWFTGNNPMCILNTKIIEIKHCRVKRKGGNQPYWAYFLYCFWYLCLQPASIRTESGFQCTALRSITKRLDYVRKQHRLNSSVCTICSTTSEIRT